MLLQSKALLQVNNRFMFIILSITDVTRLQVCCSKQVRSWCTGHDFPRGRPMRMTALSREQPPELFQGLHRTSVHAGEGLLMLQASCCSGRSQWQQ